MDDPAKYIALLGSRVEVVVDRPLGSVHPDIPSLEYNTNYGYIPETLAGDGEEIDAYVLGIEKPVERFTGICIAVILRRDDDENKVVVAAGPIDHDAVVAATDFVERDFDTEVIIHDGA